VNTRKLELIIIGWIAGCLGTAADLPVLPLGLALFLAGFLWELLAG